MKYYLPLKSNKLYGSLLKHFFFSYIVDLDSEYLCLSLM